MAEKNRLKKNRYVGLLIVLLLIIISGSVIAVTQIAKQPHAGLIILVIALVLIRIFILIITRDK